MKIHEIKIDDKDQIVGMSADVSESEARFLIGFAFNMLYKSGKLFWDTENSQWSFDNVFFKALGEQIEHTPS